VVGPLYGYALLLPGLVRQRAPVLVEEFLARPDRMTAVHDEPRSRQLTTGNIHEIGPVRRSPKSRESAP
jgi:hypothetical protein